MVSTAAVECSLNVSIDGGYDGDSGLGNNASLAALVLVHRYS